LNLRWFGAGERACDQGVLSESMRQVEQVDLEAYRPPRQGPAWRPIRPWRWRCLEAPFRYEIAAGVETIDVAVLEQGAEHLGGPGTGPTRCCATDAASLDRSNGAGSPSSMMGRTMLWSGPTSPCQRHLQPSASSVSRPETGSGGTHCGQSTRDGGFLIMSVRGS